MADLREMGVPNEVTQRHTPSCNTLALNGYNYFAADRRHPRFRAGHALRAGSHRLRLRRPVHVRTEGSTLLEDERGVSFISSHATLDAEHMAELREVLNTINDEPARNAIVEAALVNFHHFTAIMAAV